MPERIRHCVECPSCRMRYLLATTRYANGAYVMVQSDNHLEEYILYCSCSHPAAISRWSWSQLKTYIVSAAAHARGYGSPKEVFQRITTKAPHPL